MSPTLFNIYIDELTQLLENSSAPGLDLEGKEVKCLLYADDLLLLSQTKQGMQEYLNILHDYCINWAIKVNLDKTEIVIFQKKARSKSKKYQFTLGETTLSHTMEYTCLGLTITASGRFVKAVSSLADKARRAYYSIRKALFKLNPPIKIWLKIFQSIIEPYLLYGSEVWGPLIKQEHWDSNPVEKVHLEFCKNILRVHRNCPNHGCRAEPGQFPLLIKIKKRTIKFQNHLIESDLDSYQHRAYLKQQGCLNPENNTWNGINEEIRLTSQNDTTKIIPYSQIKQIDKDNKQKYCKQRKTETQTINKLECYNLLDREFQLAQYLTQIKHPQKRQTLTKYGLSDHKLAIETGRYKREWLERAKRICVHCETGEVETETHFLINCPKYNEIREELFPKFKEKIPDLLTLQQDKIIQIFLGEDSSTVGLAGEYVCACHNLRNVSM